jgi:hypothetical protein
MAKIAGETVDITPKDRLETLLAKIAGDSVSITPDDTLEYWLNQIAENGGGGGSDTITIAQKQSVTTAVSQSLPFPMGSITLADGAFETKTIDVIFDGVEYKNIPFVMSGYGDIENQMPVFTNYPFFVANSWRGGWMLFTKVAGTYEIEIKGTPTNVPYWNCHVTVINANKDTNLFAEGFIVDDAGATRHLQVINTQEFDVIAVGGFSELYFTNTDGTEGVVTNVTGSGVYVPDEGYVGVWGDVTITAKGSE